MKKILLILASYFALQSSVQAYEVRVLEKVYRPSCSYFTNITADYIVMLNVPEIAGQSYKAELHLGWNGVDGQKPFFWKNRTVVDSTRKVMNTFIFTVSESLINRGSPVRLNGLSFRIKLVASNGATTWISGKRSPLSYYQVVTKLDSNTPCPEQQKIQYEESALKVVARNDY